MNHNPRFLEIVDDAKSRVRQNDVQAVKAMLDTERRVYLVDVREDNEWNAGHLPRAIHLGKGIIERDIETAVPDLNAEIVLYSHALGTPAEARNNDQFVKEYLGIEALK